MANSQNWFGQKTTPCLPAHLASFPTCPHLIRFVKFYFTNNCLSFTDHVDNSSVSYRRFHICFK